MPVLVGALLLAGCGSSQPGAASGTGTLGSPGSQTSTPGLPTTLTTPPPRDDPTDPPLTGRSKPITATGPITVSDIEGGGCRVMTIRGQTYQLTGEGVAKLHDGQTVTVTGYADDTMVTTCQMGVVFVVTKLSSPTGS